MILVRIRLAVLLLVTALLATTGAGIWSYRVAAAAGLKGQAETSLFLSLCAAALQILIGISLFRQAHRRRRELDAIADAVRYGGVLPTDRLSRFGPLGDRIRFILKDLSEAGERKSGRIASLSGLLKAALSLVDAPVLVVALDGRVIEASRGAREDPRFKDLEVGQTTMEDLIPEAQMRTVLEEAERSHASVELPGNIHFYPVFSTRGEIGHFLADFSRMGLRNILNGLSERKPPEKPEKSEKKKARFLDLVRERWVKAQSKNTKEKG